MQTLVAAFADLCKELHGRLVCFWNSYLDIVELLLAFKRATQEGNWHLHCGCLPKMLPLFFCFDRVHRARYLTVYWSEINHLANTHTEAFDAMCNGAFAVQHGAKRTFAQVPVDQSIEQIFKQR